MNDSREPAVPRAAPAGGQQSDLRAAGRGGVAILGAKIYFVLVGLVQQIALKAILGLGGYGAYSTAQAVASITYNPVVQASIQGVSRTIAAAPGDERPVLLQKTLAWHTIGAALLGGSLFLASGFITTLIGAPHLRASIRILAVVVFVYGVYAPLIGALNGQKRFLPQALLDVAAATLRTSGLLVGAWLFVRAYGPGIPAVDAANQGFVVASLAILVLALAITGIGKAGAHRLSAREYLHFTLPILGGQLLQNVLFQADSLLLRRFLGEAALGQGLGPEAADPLVGAYRAAQMFCFLPYQLLMSVTFILFPLLAEAKGRGQGEEVQRLVRGGLRLGALSTGAMLTVLLAVPEGLIALVYGTDAAVLGAPAMRPLAIGLSAFALLGLMTSALNSLGKPGSSLKVTALATALVVCLCFAAGYRGEMNAALLLSVALATCVALVITTAISQGVLRRQAGAALELTTFLRTGLAVAVSATTTALVMGYADENSKVLTILASALSLGMYFALLTVLREIGRKDLAQLEAMLGRRR